MDSNRYINIFYQTQLSWIICCCLPLASESTRATPTRRASMLSQDKLFVFSIWFNQGIRPLSSIMLQLTSSSPAEEVSDTLTRYNGWMRWQLPLDILWVDEIMGTTLTSYEKYNIQQLVSYIRWVDEMMGTTPTRYAGYMRRKLLPAIRWVYGTVGTTLNCYSIGIWVDNSHPLFHG